MYCIWMLWKRLYGDSADKGTLQELQHLINRTNVPARPKKNAAEDFMQVVVIGHVAPLVMTHFAMVSINDEPKYSDLSKVSRCHESQKELFFRQALINMLRRHITLFKIPFTCTSTTTNDRVELYAQEMLTLGLLFFKFKDPIRCGDGEHVSFAGNFPPHIQGCSKIELCHRSDYLPCPSLCGTTPSLKRATHMVSVCKCNW